MGLLTVTAAVAGFTVPTDVANAAPTSYGAQRTVIGPASRTITFTADPAGDVFAASKASALAELPQGSNTPVALPIHARFFGMAADAAGDLFFTQSTDGTRVQWLPAGTNVRRTLPFSGLSHAGAVAVDHAGDVFVADVGNERIVELPAGSRSQITLSFTGLDNPTGVAVDGSGDVYVADSGNKRILELPAGSHTQTTLPFTGLSRPTGLAVDHARDVYVADPDAHQVVELPAGSSTQTQVPIGGVQSPTQVAADTAGDLFVLDTSVSNWVLRFPAGAGAPTVLLPFPGVSPSIGLAIGPTGDLYAADGRYKRIVELPAGSSTLTARFLTYLTDASAVAVDAADNLYLALHVPDRRSQVIEFPAGSETPITLPFTDLDLPIGLAVDSSGDVYVLEGGYAQAVVELPAGSDQQETLPLGGSYRLAGIAVDGAGDVYVADDANRRVEELPAGAGSQVTLPFTGLSSAGGVAVDRAGDVYVSDTQNQRVVELPAGSGTQVTLPFTSLQFPGAVAVDRSNDVYVASWGKVVELPVAPPPPLPPVVTSVSPSNGPTAGGTTITVTGSHFGPKSVVLLDRGPSPTADALQATVTGVGPTRVTATTPRGASGVWNVFVETRYGPSDANFADRFTYDPPSVSGIAPDAAPATGGTTITLTGTGFTAHATVRIAQPGNTKLIITPDSSTPTQITFTTPPGVAGTWPLTVRTAYGTTGGVPFSYT